MNKSFSIVAIGGRQYKVKVGDMLKVEKEDEKEGKTITFDKVLLVSKDGKVTIGTPTVKGAAVVAKVIEQGKGKKVNIFKYKSKSRYRRKMGHRQKYTKLEIIKI